MVEESKTQARKNSAPIGVDELASLTANLTIDRKKKRKEQKAAPQISVKSKKISKREKREKQKKVQCRK